MYGGSKEYNWYMAEFYVRLDLPAKFISIYNWHNNITDNQSYIIFLECYQCFAAIRSEDDIIITGYFLSYKFPHFSFILYKKYFRERVFKRAKNFKLVMFTQIQSIRLIYIP